MFSAVCDSVRRPLPPPFQTRFVTKYRASDGVLVLKVTNDITCLKFKTDAAADLKNVERLSGWFLSQATRKRTPAVASGAAAGAGAE